MNSKGKQKWMMEFEKFTVERSVYAPGKVNWDTATYYFNTGMSAWDAANSVHSHLVSRLEKREPEVRKITTEIEEMYNEKD